MKVLVTGAGGFLGGVIARQLRERGDEVHTLQRGDYPHLEALGCVQHRGSLTDPDFVERSTRGMDAVIHVAARAGVWGTEEAFFDANVTGTWHVVDACIRAGVPRLVYTSTPSVVHGGGDVAGVDESAPYPEHFAAPYPRTKALAERDVLLAHGKEGLATVALRPHLVWGPGDPHFLPRLIDRHRKGRLRLVDGGRHVIDTVHVENAAHAHLLALDRLRLDAPCGGRAFFITQGEPLPQAEFVHALLDAVGMDGPLRSVPGWVARMAGAVLEDVWRWTGRSGEPPMTRFVAEQLSTAHWYDLTAARTLLDYAPRLTLAEGMDDLARWWRDTGGQGGAAGSRG
jgi:nucleoside-diphosphate-sugar epimerase